MGRQVRVLGDDTVSSTQDTLVDTLESVALAELRPHPRNYQTHPDTQLASLMESLRTHGVYRNVVIARDGTILAGHGVIEAARRLGYTHLSVQRMDLDPEESAALQIVIGDNELARLALKDEQLLATLLTELAEQDPSSLLGTGYDETTLELLIQQQPSIDEATPPESFPAYDETIPIAYCCPQCGYEWSGRPA
jgi:hypothetical protein